MSDDLTPHQPPREPPRRVHVTDRRATGERPVEETVAPGSNGDPADDVETARAETAQHLEDLKRLKAEFDNYRKRMVREQTQMIERATDGLVERILPILDNFELALIAADRTQDYASMVKGVEMVFGELLETLRKEGLERIDALHQPFDPEQHEAVMRGEGEGDELIVVEEMRPGYRIGGRVVRPSMVKVAPRTTDEESEQE